MKSYARTTGLSIDNSSRLVANFVAILGFTALIMLAMSQPVAAQGVLWATRAGGSGLDRAWAIAQDGLGNTFVTGFFNGTATFGLGEANETTLASGGGDDMFVAQYDSSGLLAVGQAGGWNRIAPRFGHRGRWIGKQLCDRLD